MSKDKRGRRVSLHQIQAQMRAACVALRLLASMATCLCLTAGPHPPHPAPLHPALRLHPLPGLDGLCQPQERAARAGGALHGCQPQAHPRLLHISCGCEHEVASLYTCRGTCTCISKVCLCRWYVYRAGCCSWPGDASLRRQCEL